MALSNVRKVAVGETPYAHEREALDFAFSVFPDSDPFHVWALTELLEPSSGCLYELDLLVLGYSALYLVEIKSGSGRYEGDHQEWWRTPPGAARGLYMDGPLSLCNLKAKVLRSRLQSKMKQPGRCPYIEPLIFLSAIDLDVRLKPEGRIHVVTRKDLLQAVQHHKFPRANPSWRGERIDGAGHEVEITQPWSALAQEGWVVYQAPELRDNPLARSPQSDIFSLGALAYFAFTGRAPAERVEDIDKRLQTERYLDPRAVDDGMRARVAEVFAFATDAAPVNRADNVDEWLEILLDVATAPDQAPVADEVDPLEAIKETVLGGGLEVRAVLGVGATARVLLVRRLKDDRYCALKIASDPSHDARLADEDLHVSTAGLDAKIAAGFIDGGFPTLRTVAHAPAMHVECLAKHHAIDIELVRQALAEENERANQRARPTTLEGWIEALLSRKKGRKDRHLVRALFGLDAPFEGRLDATVRELADKEEKSTAAVYVALGKARDDWAQHAALPEVREQLTTLVESVGGASSLLVLGNELARAIPHGSDASPELLRAMGAALFRVVVEVDKESATGLRLVRLHDREPWIFLSDEHARLTRLLGQTADALAARTTLISTGEVRRAFAEVVAGTPLAAIKEERLLEIAAAASKGAACSARLEIYPRGLNPKRSIELCAATFKGGVTEADVRARVAIRYPAAAPLPARPDLDALLEPLGFRWDNDSGRYARPGETDATTLQTRMSALGRIPTALPSQARAMDPEAIDARQFDEKLKHALEMNAFRVVGVTADRARDAAAVEATRPAKFADVEGTRL